MNQPAAWPVGLIALTLAGCATRGELLNQDRQLRRLMQEQRKLGLGAQDNALIEAASAEAIGRMERCADPCARVYRTDDVRGFVARRLLVEDFFRQRVGAFVDVEEEEVAREIDRRRSREGAGPETLRPEEIRKELFDEKMERARRNWFDRATSKSRIVLSPLEEQ